VKDQYYVSKQVKVDPVGVHMQSLGGYTSPLPAPPPSFSALSVSLWATPQLWS